MIIIFRLLNNKAMANKTAMQEMLEWVRKTFPMDLDTPRMIEDKIESLLPTEKEQIKDAFDEGNKIYYVGGPNEYYKKTYGTEQQNNGSMKIFNGDVFDIGQTINGVSKFILYNNRWFYYREDMNQEYEYAHADLTKLIYDDKMNGFDEVKFLGNIFSYIE